MPFDLWHDIRFAARLLIKDRWFTLAAATALALGIGANAAVFTFVNAVLVRGLPFHEADRIMTVWTEDDRGRRLGTSELGYEDWREEARSFSDLAATLGSPINVSDEGRTPERVQGAYVTANLFSLIGQSPVIGRDFTDADDQPGAEPVTIIGHSVWQNRYDSDPGVLGHTLKANSKGVTIIGVMPPDMRFPNNVDIWVPRAQLPPETLTGKRDSRNLNVIGRLADGVSVDQARVELTSLGQRLSQAYPATNEHLTPNLLPYAQGINGPELKLVFLSLQGAVVFVLLIACANVANLLLARSAHRSQEMSIRAALGASRWRVVRQLLVESVMLACLAGVAGFGLAVAGVGWFDAATQDVGRPYWMEFTMDGTVFAFIAAICLATGVLFGLAPALHVSKTDVNEVLKEGGRGGHRRGPRAPVDTHAHHRRARADTRAAGRRRIHDAQLPHVVSDGYRSGHVAAADHADLPAADEVSGGGPPDGAVPPVRRAAGRHLGHRGQCNGDGAAVRRRRASPARHRWAADAGRRGAAGRHDGERR